MTDKPKFGMKTICQFLGVSPATIRIYEQHLDFENRNYEVRESGHRQFTGSSLVHLYDLRYMSKSGLSIKDAAAAIQSDSISQRVSAYIEGELELRRQQHYLQAALREVEETKKRLRQLEYGNATFSIENVPGFYYLECERNGRIIDEPEDLELMEAWTSMFPAVYYMNRDIMEAPDGSQWSYRMGLAVSDAYSSLVPVNHRSVTHYPAQKCVVGVIVDEDEESLASDDYSYSSKCLKLALEYIDRNGYTLAGQIFHRFIGSMLNVRDAEGTPVRGGLWFGIYPIA